MIIKKITSILTAIIFIFSIILPYDCRNANAVQILSRRELNEGNEYSPYYIKSREQMHESLIIEKNDSSLGLLNSKYNNAVENQNMSNEETLPLKKKVSADSSTENVSKDGEYSVEITIPQRVEIDTQTLSATSTISTISILTNTDTYVYTNVDTERSEPVPVNTPSALLTMPITQTGAATPTATATAAPTASATSTPTATGTSTPTVSSTSTTTTSSVNDNASATGSYTYTFTSVMTMVNVDIETIIYVPVPVKSYTYTMFKTSINVNSGTAIRQLASTLYDNGESFDIDGILSASPQEISEDLFYMIESADPGSGPIILLEEVSRFTNNERMVIPYSLGDDNIGYAEFELAEGWNDLNIEAATSDGMVYTRNIRVYRDARSNEEIAHKLVDLGYFTEEEYRSYIESMPFETVFNMIGYQTISNILINGGYLKTEIRTFADLINALISKGIDPYELKLKPDGFITAINDTRGEGSLFKEWDGNVQKSDFNGLMNMIIYHYARNIRNDLVANGYIDYRGQILPAFNIINSASELIFSNSRLANERQRIYSILKAVAENQSLHAGIRDFNDIAISLYNLNVDYLWGHLVTSGYINGQGIVQDKFFTEYEETDTINVSWVYKTWQNFDVDICNILSGWAETLVAANTVKELIKSQFENDPYALIDNLSVPEFLTLLGSPESAGTPVIDPISAHTWTPIDGKYFVNAAPVIYNPSLSDPSWRHNYWYDGHIGDDSLQVVADRLNQLPEDNKVLFLNLYSFLETDAQGGIVTNPLDYLRDSHGNIIYGENGSALCFPSMEEWKEEIVRRMDDLGSQLSQILNNPDMPIKVMVDYECWDIMSGTFMELFKKSDNTYDFSPLLLDSKFQAVMDEIGLTENDILTMNTWAGHNSRDQRAFKWNQYAWKARNEAWGEIFSAFRNYFPNAIGTNWCDYTFSQTLPATGQYQYFPCMWGIGNITEGTSPTNNFYGGSLYNLGPDLEFYGLEDATRVSWEGVRDPYDPVFDPDAYNSTFYALQSAFQLANSMSSSTALQSRHWITYFNYRDGSYGDESLNIGSYFREHIKAEIRAEFESRYGTNPTDPDFDLNNDGAVNALDADLADNIQILTGTEYETVKDKLLHIITVRLGATSEDLLYINRLDFNKDNIIDEYDYKAMFRMVYLPKTAWGEGYSSTEYGDSMGTLMAEEIFRIAADCEAMQFWNYSEWYGRTPTQEDLDLVHRTLSEANELLGYSDREIIDGSLCLNGRRVSAGAVNVNFDSNFSYFCARANGRNVYRIVLNKEVLGGTGRSGAIINDGTNGEPVVLRISSNGNEETISISDAYIYYPEDEVSDNGFWVIQNPDAFGIVTTRQPDIFSALANEDTTPPMVTILNAPEITNQSKLTLQYYVDNNIDEIFTKEFELTEGMNFISFDVADNEGNITNVSFVVELDTSAPVVDILYELSAYDADNGLIINYTVDNDTTNILTQIFNLAAGENNLTLNACDAAGNTTNIDFTVSLSVNGDDYVINISPPNGNLLNSDLSDTIVEEIIQTSVKNKEDASLTNGFTPAPNYIENTILRNEYYNNTKIEQCKTKDGISSDILYINISNNLEDKIRPKIEYSTQGFENIINFLDKNNIIKPISQYLYALPDQHILRGFNNVNVFNSKGGWSAISDSKTVIINFDKIHSLGFDRLDLIKFALSDMKACVTVNKQISRHNRQLKVQPVLRKKKTPKSKI